MGNERQDRVSKRKDAADQDVVEMEDTEATVNVNVSSVDHADSGGSDDNGNGNKKTKSHKTKNQAPSNVHANAADANEGNPSTNKDDTTTIATSSPPPSKKMKRSNTCPLPASPPSTSLSKSTSASASSSAAKKLHDKNAKTATTKNNKILARSQSDRGVCYQGQGQGIDAHPFARGSVIEVLWGVAPKAKASFRMRSGSDEEDDEEDEEDDEEEDYEDEEEQELVSEGSPKDPNSADAKEEKPKPKSSSVKPEVRLADIIDRAPSKTPDHANPCYRWKYYIHYREYNRRMDEWITDPTRIISPPSVGNAKVRALKKAKAAKLEEERKAREREKRAREQAEVLAEIQGKRRRDGDVSGDSVGGEGGDTSAIVSGGEGDGSVTATSTSPLGRVSQRASSRRASKAIAASSSQASSSVSGNGSLSQSQSDYDGVSAGGGGGTNQASLDEQERLRLTRSQRRKSTRGTGGGGSGGVGDEADENDKKRNASSTATGSGMVVTTLLPDDKMIQDKVVTVAAQELDEHEGLDEASLREHEEVTKVKNVNEVELGRYRMDTWYFSPLPKELLKDGNMVEVLHVCEFTLQFFARKEELLRFQRKQLPKNKRHPPGNEIYRNGNLSMFEVDGFEERIYCQNLCYIAKLFLDHKTLYFDVDPFLFYVLCEFDERGFHPVGYYSKEKYSDVGYNLACILTFPCHQRKGYGRFLIDFSYELSKKEEKVGSPEKPMSDLGQQAYKPYWTSTIVDFLLNQSDEKSMSIMDISKRTSIMAEDIIFTLNMLGLLKYINGIYFITAERTLLQELAKKHPVKEPRVDPSKLHWTPYLTDVKRDKFSIHSKKPSVEGEAHREKGGF